MDDEGDRPLAEYAAETPRRILVVDDDWMNREVMEARLANAGYDVLTANSGEEALALAANDPPDLILLDVRMQGASGYEVCRQLKSQPGTQSVPVILVTALDNDEAQTRARSAGAEELIAKSCPAFTLLAHIHQHLHIKQP